MSVLHPKKPNWSAYSLEEVEAFEEECLAAAEAELGLHRNRIEELGYVLVPLVVCHHGGRSRRPHSPEYQSQVEVSLRHNDDPMYPNYSFYRSYPLWTGGKGPETTASELAEAVRLDLQWLVNKLYSSCAGLLYPGKPRSAAG